MDEKKKEEFLKKWTKDFKKPKDNTASKNQDVETYYTVKNGIEKAKTEKRKRKLNTLQIIRDI